MKIVQLVSNLHPTNPLANHAINSHAATLSNGLVDRGYEVHLFGTSDSETKAQLHYSGPALSKMNIPESVRQHYMIEHVSRCYEFAKTNVDIVHSHLNLFPSFFSNLIDVPTISSLHTPIREEIKPLLNQYKNNKYISFSLAQRKQMPHLNWYANIYHGVDTNVFAFNAQPEDYLLYLGRVTEDKGVHFAIEAAKAAGVPLRIVGASYPEEGYWHKYIEPHINGETIRYLGEASFEKKIPLFQNARALLFPTHDSDPFGYVMIEAMACGTPVIGFNKSAVPEIVKNGETGFVVKDVEGMVKAIKKLDKIDRLKVRQRAETYFSVEKMVAGYEKVYQRVLEEAALKKAKNSK